MTYDDLKEIIRLGEGETIEFKSAFGNEAIETLVAFANTRGGTVVIGINPVNKITGINTNPETIQNWVNEIKNKTAPQIIPDADSLIVENKQVIILTVQEYPVKPVSTRGRYFKRVANSNHLLSISEVVNIHLQTFNTSWDYYLNDEFKIENISIDKVQKAIELVTDEKLKSDPLTFLFKNDLIRNNKVTNAAYLLFTKEDTVLTTIEMGRFQSPTIIKDNARSKSDILTQIKEVTDFVMKHLNKEVIITDKPRHTQKWQYPLEAIREIIINMIIHRDYRSSSDSIVKVFDHKIEFYNPGRLPETISVEDLISNKYKSTPRNKLVADFCRSIGLIEKYGTGIQRVINLLREARLPAPEFRNISDGFQVTVFDSYKDVGKDVG
ncbi:MAG: putative DNA binding domain-containing protein, partial [Bacteroidales bacterium]|nr:putative DNA binding domain-containing protein [Bacteroidales bacterium]